MDISKLDVDKISNEGIRFIVKTEMGEDTDIAITIEGQYSAGYWESKEKAVTEEEKIQWLAEKTRNIEGITDKGKPIPFSTEFAVKVYTMNKSIRLQANLASVNVMDFTRG